MARAQSALAYLEQGFHLLALRGKRPHPRWHSEWSWDNSFHGHPESEAQRAAVTEVFDDPSVTGIAILIPQHVLVADIDTEEAAELFQNLAGTPHDTAMARTTKGLHVWYMAPGASGSRWLGGRTLLFKGFGGYVAVEPSAHFADDTLKVQDGTYTWLIPPPAIDFLPEGIDTMLRADMALADMLPHRNAADNDMSAFELQLVDGKWTGDMWPTWHMDGLAHVIEKAAEGNQNNLVAWCAMVAADGGVPHAVAVKELVEAAVRGNHPRKRALATVNGVYKRRSRS